MTRKRIYKIDLFEESKTTNLDELFSKFVIFKKAQKMSERTIDDYLITFKRFKKICKVKSIEETEQIKSDLLTFFASLRNKAPATYNIPYKNLNTFFNWCVHEEIISENPLIVTGLKKVKDEGRVRNVEEEAIKKLLDSCDLTTYAGFRDYCIFLLTMDTGIRPNEAFNLLVSDVDFDANLLTVRKEIAKTRTQRVLPLSQQTITCLEKLVSFKPKEWRDNFLFYTIDGEQITTHMWAKKLYRISQEIGYKITPYDLRHTFAIMFLRNGGHVFSLQRMLGHADLTMTKRYVNLVLDDIKTQHTTASPLNNFVRRSTRVIKLHKN